jgi:hypothetical protein
MIVKQRDLMIRPKESGGWRDDSELTIEAVATVLSCQHTEGLKQPKSLEMSKITTVYS